MTTLIEENTPVAEPAAVADPDTYAVPRAVITTEQPVPVAADELDTDPEAGRRQLTGHDYLVSAVWGIAGAVATTAVSVLFLPVHLLALTFILGAGLGTLGYLDHCTQLIRNKHSLVFGIAAALLLVACQVISPGSSILLPAAIAAVVAFVFMLGLTVCTGFAGGGDIKLSPIPAALLAAVSPIAAMMWLLFTFVLCLAGMVSARLAGSKRKHVAMAPFMAVAAVLSILVYGLLKQSLGI